MARLGDILYKNLRSQGLAETVEAARIVTALQELIGKEFPEEVASRMAAVHLKHYALTVRVDSSAVGQELKMHERELLEQLAKQFPSVRIDRIRVEV